jgi:hypothetical protein
MSGESQNGLTFGASLTARSGDDVDLDVGDLGVNDGTGDTTANGGAANDGAIKSLSDMSFGSIYVSGAFGTLTFDREGIDNVMDDAFSHDMSYAYSAGDLSVTVTADMDDDGAALADGEKWAASVGYTMDAIALTVKTDDSSETDVTVAYTLNDMIGLSVNFDSNGQTVNSVATDETIVKATYANDGVTAHVAWADDDDDAWEIGLGYTAGAMTFGVVAAEDGDGTKTEMDVTASYDLGGGMSIKGATNETGAWFVGTALAF